MLVDCSHRSQSDTFGPSAANYGCNGGFADKTADFIQEWGMLKAEGYEYTARRGTCRYDDFPVEVTPTFMGKMSNPTEQELVTAMETSPLSIGFWLSRDFLYLSTDAPVMESTDRSLCEPVIGGHIVPVVGYTPGSDEETTEE